MKLEKGERNAWYMDFIKASEVFLAEIVALHVTGRAEGLAWTDLVARIVTGVIGNCCVSGCSQMNKVY